MSEEVYLRCNFEARVRGYFRPATYDKNEYYDLVFTDMNISIMARLPQLTPTAPYQTKLEKGIPSSSLVHVKQNLEDQESYSTMLDDQNITQIAYKNIAYHDNEFYADASGILEGSLTIINPSDTTIDEVVTEVLPMPIVKKPAAIAVPKREYNYTNWEESKRNNNGCVDLFYSGLGLVYFTIILIVFMPIIFELAIKFFQFMLPLVALLILCIPFILLCAIIYMLFTQKR